MNTRHKKSTKQPHSCYNDYYQKGQKDYKCSQSCREKDSLHIAAGRVSVRTDYGEKHDSSTK